MACYSYTSMYTEVEKRKINSPGFVKKGSRREVSRVCAVVQDGINGGEVARNKISNSRRLDGRSASRNWRLFGDCFASYHHSIPPRLASQ